MTPSINIGLGIREGTTTEAQEARHMSTYQNKGRHRYFLQGLGHAFIIDAHCNRYSFITEAAEFAEQVWQVVRQKTRKQHRHNVQRCPEPGHPFDARTHRRRASSSSAPASADCGRLEGLANGPAEVAVIDRENYHLFQPLLYQVATAGLSPADIAAPIRGIVGAYRNVAVMPGEIVGVYVAARMVSIIGGRDRPATTMSSATRARLARRISVTTIGVSSRCADDQLAKSTKAISI